MATVLNHPRLGEVLGAPHESEEVVQYLGIQYATLGHRFASAEVKTEYGGKVDATSWGYVSQQYSPALSGASVYSTGNIAIEAN